MSVVQTRLIECPNCKGSGRFTGFDGDRTTVVDVAKCARCKGTGRILVRDESGEDG